MKKANVCITAFICLIVAVLVFTGFLGRFLSVLNPVRGANELYLASAQEKAVGGFLVLSGVKTGLAIIEGSELNVGILGSGASIEAGDAVKAVYDLVDWLWRTSFLGGIMLTAMRTALQLSALISPWALGLGAILIACCALTFNSLRQKPIFLMFYNGAILTFFVFLLCQIAVPFSVWGASKLSCLLTAQVAQEAEQNFRSFGTVFDRQADETLSSYGKRLASGLPEIYKSCKENLHKLVVSGIKYVTAYLFDCLIFPILMFHIIKQLLLAFLNYFFKPVDKENFNTWLESVFQNKPLLKAGKQ